MASILRVRQGN